MFIIMHIHSTHSQYITILSQWEIIFHNKGYKLLWQLEIFKQGNVLLPKIPMHHVQCSPRHSTTPLIPTATRSSNLNNDIAHKFLV